MTVKPRPMMECPACDGKGQRAMHVCATCPHKVIPCPTCGGIGLIEVPDIVDSES